MSFCTLQLRSLLFLEWWLGFASLLLEVIRLLALGFLGAVFCGFRSRFCIIVPGYIIIIIIIIRCSGLLLHSELGECLRHCVVMRVLLFRLAAYRRDFVDLLERDRDGDRDGDRERFVFH